MNLISFWKMNGGGNDFIVIDNRTNNLADPADFAKTYCDRHNGIGADGVILIEQSKKHDFVMRIFNSDGSEAEMCGNGARCAVYFAYENAIFNKPETTFETKAGLIKGAIRDGLVKVKLTKPKHLRLNFMLEIDDKAYNANFIDTGVPHTVFLLTEIESLDVNEFGSKVRFLDNFKPAGTNVDFISVTDQHNIKLRTYERGVESETNACGTGAVASALISSQKGRTQSPVSVHTRGGEILTVYFDNDEVYLEGGVKKIFNGELDL